MARTWPGFVVARKVEVLIEDGIVTDAERAHLLQTLTEFSPTDFALTGSSSPEVAALPIDDVVTVILRDAGVCQTGGSCSGLVRPVSA